MPSYYTGTEMVDLRGQSPLNSSRYTLNAVPNRSHRPRTNACRGLRLNATTNSTIIHKRNSGINLCSKHLQKRCHRLSCQTPKEKLLNNPCPLKQRCPRSHLVWDLCSSVRLTRHQLHRHSHRKSHLHQR